MKEQSLSLDDMLNTPPKEGTAPIRYDSVETAVLTTKHEDYTYVLIRDSSYVLRTHILMHF